MKKPSQILQQLLKDIKKSKQKTDSDISTDAKSISPAHKAKSGLCSMLQKISERVAAG